MTIVIGGLAGVNRARRQGRIPTGSSRPEGARTHRLIDAMWSRSGGAAGSVYGRNGVDGASAFPANSGSGTSTFATERSIIMPQRSRRPEVMDQPGLDFTEHARALQGLGRINTISRTSAHFW